MTTRCWIIAILLVPAVGAAQSPDATGYTGYELALAGGSTVRAGRSAHFHGVAYRVRGLATLEPYAGPVRARVVRGDADESPVPWTATTSAVDGRLSLDVPVTVTEEARLEVEVGPVGAARALEMPLHVQPAVDLVLRVDRALYQPGEPVYVFGLLRDAATGRPLADEAVELELSPALSPSNRVTLHSDASGVVTLDARVPEHAPEGAAWVHAIAAGQRTERAAFRIGTRTYERMFAEVEVAPDPVAPGATTQVTVTVTASGGSPIAGARVTLEVDGDVSYGGVSDSDGRARIDVVAPSYHAHESGRIPLAITAAHPAHGSVARHESFGIEVPLILAVELVPRAGGLIPELDDVLFLRLRDGLHGPPSGAQRVTLTGAPFAGGAVTVETDANGLAEVPVRLPRGAASGDPSRSDLARTVVRATVHGPVDRLTRIELPVLRDVDVLAVPSHPVIDTGAPIEVALLRTADAARRPIMLEARSEGGELLAAVEVAPSARVAALRLPDGHLGLIALRARVVREGESWSSRGSVTSVIVRPPRPDFLALDPTRPRWSVGETATLTLSTQPGTSGHAAVLVRDLAAHGGESPFREHFLGRRFLEAVLDPTSASGERVARVVLAADAASFDPAPVEAPPRLDALGLPPDGSMPERDRARGELRDPFPLAHELSRRGLGEAMRLSEQRLADALDGQALDAISRGAGASRVFLDTLFEGDDLETLGGGALTPAMLTEADPSFDYQRVARRVARRRLIGLLIALSRFLDPGDDALPADRMAAREPFARWLPRMVELGHLAPSDLNDPWGGQFSIRPSRAPVLVVSTHATGLELFSPGPDGRAGTADDVRDPFARAVDAGTPYAIASGEDRWMRSLAVMSPVSRTLALLDEAYDRLNVEIAEELIGDAVAGGVGEGTIGLGSLGTIGHGGGGGTGSGYGSGSGGLRSRSARTPSVRAGTAGGMGIASIVRERFPPTLLFERHLPLDPSGHTAIEVPLADAVTTYLVEAVVWRDDGWIWSESARVEVDRDIVIDAPVPAIARRGDRIELPLRVSNRSDRPQALRVRLRGDDALGIADAEVRTLTLAPHTDGMVPVAVSFDRVGEGTLTTVVEGEDGRPLDAVRRPVRVLEPSRRVTITREAFVDSRTIVELDVPAGARAHDATVRLDLAISSYPPLDRDPVWTGWAPSPGREPDATAMPTRLPSLAFWIASEWVHGRASAESVEEAAARFTRALDELAERRSVSETQRRGFANILLGLSRFSERSLRETPEGMAALIARLRREVASQAMVEEDPLALARAAAALSWSTSSPSSGGSLAELARRVERRVVRVGDRAFLPSATDTNLATLFFAMTQQALGRRGRAFELLRAVRTDRGIHIPRSESDDGLYLDAVRALARALVTRMNAGDRPARAVVLIDGQPTTVGFEDGAAHLGAPALASPGHHVIEVRAAGPVFVSVSSRFGVPWASQARGAYALGLEGQVGAVDGATDLELVVQNRAPRTLPVTEVQVELPTGAEVSQELREATPYPIEVGGGVMTVRLPPMRPGNRLRFRLPLRWTLPGTLAGIGVAATPTGTLGPVSVLVPAPLEIRGDVVGGSRRQETGGSR